VKGLIAGFAMALSAAALSFTAPAPASAQVGIRAGDSGVSVRIGEPRRDYRDRRDYRRYDRAPRVSHRRAGCREVTVRERRPGGTVVSRTRVVC